MEKVSLLVQANGGKACKVSKESGTIPFARYGLLNSIQRRTEYQPLPYWSPSEIAIRDRSHIRCEWGQKSFIDLKTPP
jgi:hypothetical protein